MGNLDRLNETIEKLEVQSKDIERVIEKQQTLNELINKSDIAIEKIKNTTEMIQECIDVIDKYNINVTKLTESIETVDDDVREVNIEVVKRLNEVIAENHKLINSFNNALEAKIGLLKSDLLVESRKTQEQIIEYNNKVITKLEESNVRNDLNVKKQQVFNIVIVVLIAISIICNLIK